MAAARGRVLRDGAAHVSGACSLLHGQVNARLKMPWLDIWAIEK